jgi:hypothetical protein
MNDRREGKAKTANPPETGEPHEKSPKPLREAPIDQDLTQVGSGGAAEHVVYPIVITSWVKNRGRDESRNFILPI